MSSSTSSSSDLENEVSIIVQLAKKWTYPSRKKSVEDTSTSQNVPDSHDISSLVLPRHSVDYTFIEP